MTPVTKDRLIEGLSEDGSDTAAQNYKEVLSRLLKDLHEKDLRIKELEARASVSPHSQNN